MIFNEERASYYKAKKREMQRKRASDAVIKEDALYVHHYGMSAFIELFPEIKHFGISYHRSLIQELESLRLAQLGEKLTGYYMASAATKDRKANRKFRKMIKGLNAK